MGSCPAMPPRVRRESEEEDSGSEALLQELGYKS